MVRDRVLDSVEQVLARRAEALAVAGPTDAQDDTFEALVFAVGAEFYAFPGAQVHEVRPVGWLTPLPGTPAFIAGLINVRGRIVTVLDLRPLIGLPSGDTPGMSVVLVSNRGADVGILTTDRPTVRLVRTDELAEAPAGALSGLDSSCVRGVTPGLIAVLDAERLLADPRLVVQHEVLPKA